MRASISRVALAAACALAAPGLHAEAARTLLPSMDAAAVPAACDAGLARAGEIIGAMEAKEGGETFLGEWNALQVAMEDVSYPIANLSYLHPDKAVRDAADACLRKYTALGTDLFQNEKLYRRLAAVAPAGKGEEKLKRDLVQGFEDSGVALPPDKRARAKALYAQLEKLRQDFERNVREDPTRVTFTAAELEGLDAAFLARQQKDEGGNLVLTLDDPVYVKVMSQARREETRRRYFIARANKGGLANLDLLEESFGLRRELAGLYGLPSYADFALRRKMVGKPEVVNRFLADVKRALGEVEARELAVLEAAKRKDLGAEAKLARWDLSYYQEQVRRERFAVDQEKYRRYFPTEKTLAFSMRVAERLYGVRFREVPGVAVWHPDVRYFDMFDARTGDFVAGLYVDLYTRPGKRNGAWQLSVRRASTLAGRKPVSVLATNFPRDGLNARERETMLHEFGHSLHTMLSSVPYVAQTSTKRDFVEAPSQMFEEWIRREQPLALMREVCPECPKLTREDIGRLEEARRFGQGIGYSAQWTYATLDMALATEPRHPRELWRQIESGTPLGHVEGTWRPASFTHIAGSGYAAGYYGYMWSEVIGLDLLTPFRKDMLDPAVGRRFRDLVLSQGGQDEEMNLVRAFLGREPSSEAFFAEITGKR